VATDQESELGPGAVDAGDGIAVILTVEPIQTAATTVSGARPMAVLGSLRLAEGESQLEQAAAAISRCADSLGAPLVSAEVQFEPGYEGSSLTTVMTVSTAPAEHPPATAPPLLTDRPPYEVEPQKPTEPMYLKGPMLIPTGWSGGGTLVKMLESANLTSRPAPFAHAGASVLEPPGIAAALAGNGRRVAVDPRAGTAEAVYACAAELACVGAEPIGLGCCLNFGDPENPNVAWQLAESIDGLKQASADLEIPIVGASASLDKESPHGPILPTPIVGMVGRRPGAAPGPLGFRNPGERIALVGSFNPLRDGSEIAKLHGHPLAGMIPFKDSGAIRQAHELVREGVRSGRFTSARDIAEGGLAIALAESCIAGGEGARVLIRGFIDVFGEDLGTAFLVTGSEQDLDGLNLIGEVGGDQLDIHGVLIVPVSDLRASYDRGLTP
jgi:phosphoribosylformylglycinamidine synthase subunit PurL